MIPLPSKTVRQILEHKGRVVWSVGTDTSVCQALALMAERGIGAVVVLEEERLVGIFSERDFARRMVAVGVTTCDAPIREVMTSPVYRVGPEDSIDRCMALMTEKRIRHLPVTDEQKVIGVISIGDVVKSVLSEQEFTIEQLERYITGR